MMEVEYINIRDSKFHQVFDFSISELDYVVGGVCVTENSEFLGVSIVYRNPYLKSPNENALLFGYFKATSLDVASKLLNKIQETALEYELNQIIGPINGSTWYNYRLMDAYENNAFLGEEVTPVEYNDYLLSNGFEIVKTTLSNVLKSSMFSESTIVEKEEELKRANWTVRTIDKNNLKEELHRIAQFSNMAFASNFLFSPIKVQDFIEKYMPLMTTLNTEFVWLIENEKGDLQALILAYENGVENSELVLKSTARHPLCSIKGLGTYLCHKVSKQAYEKGTDKVIHAYIASDNVSSMSQEQFQAIQFRKYNLYCKGI